MTDEKEQEKIKIPLENYLKGHTTGNPEFMRKAFYEQGKVTFVREGKYIVKTFKEFIDGFNGKPAPDEAQRKRWIESIDVSGSAAFAKIILDYPNGKFTDYLTLLKISGEWKIISKSFDLQPKSGKNYDPIHFIFNFNYLGYHGRNCGTTKRCKLGAFYDSRCEGRNAETV